MNEVGRVTSPLHLDLHLGGYEERLQRSGRRRPLFVERSTGKISGNATAFGGATGALETVGAGRSKPPGSWIPRSASSLLLATLTLVASRAAGVREVAASPCVLHAPLLTRGPMRARTRSERWRSGLLGRWRQRVRGWRRCRGALTVSGSAGAGPGKGLWLQELLGASASGSQSGKGCREPLRNTFLERLSGLRYRATNGGKLDPCGA